MDSLAQLKSKGIIRAHGVSCHSLAALEAAAAEPWVDSVHARINPFGMSMDDKPDKVVPVLKKLHAAGKASWHEDHRRRPAGQRCRKAR